ncbi:MAG: queuosine salvage family protein [Thermodesulfobacteriota bacterium]
MQEVLETCRDVARRSRHVIIDEKALTRFCGRLIDREVTVSPWDWHHHFRGGEEETVAYLLVLDTLNFCFWPGACEKRWEIRYEGERLSGYLGLAACLKMAVEAGIPVTDAEYLARLSMEEFRQVLSGEGELQLMERRLEALRELGEILRRDYRGRASLLVASAGKSSVKLTRLLAERLASFRDVADYDGGRVLFYKRAQIVAADLNGALEGKGPGAFSDMDELTAFADYKLPQVLRHLGILHYSPSLAQKVDDRVLIAAGSPEEVEIRAATIVAVDMIRQELSRLGREYRAFEIDWILWNLGQSDEYRLRPYHRTVTVFY